VYLDILRAKFGDSCTVKYLVRNKIKFIARLSTDREEIFISPAVIY